VSGDIDEAEGKIKVSELIAKDKSIASRLKFVPTDLTNYDDVYYLFQVAYETFGRVDIAANIAGLPEKAGWFDSPETLESVKKVKKIPSLIEKSLHSVAN
jgi:NAD(P)-dependent dehydrogenase (short-subunit alcohol dehydrogenase family)